jgi:hypothetical protein
MADGIHVTRGLDVSVLPGKNSAYDFNVVYTEPEKRTRTPRHVQIGRSSGFSAHHSIAPPFC